VRLPPGLELDLLSEQSVLSLRVPAVDEVAAIVAASQVVRVLLGRWPGLLSAGVRAASDPGPAGGYPGGALGFRPPGAVVPLDGGPTTRYGGPTTK
jgi:hypothetical protein